MKPLEPVRCICSVKMIVVDHICEVQVDLLFTKQLEDLLFVCKKQHYKMCMCMTNW